MTDLEIALERLRRAFRQHDNWKLRDLLREEHPILYTALVDVVTLTAEPED